MSEYKENTVGWQLSQLKEPLKSRALELVKEDETDEFLASSLTEAIDAIIDAHPWMDDSTFWRGVNDFFYGESQLDSEDENGWEMAKECAPDNWLKPKDGGEDKAIVDSPKKTRELFFYADETLINPLQNPFKEPLVIYPRGEMNSVIVEEDKIKELMNANPGIIFWPTNVGGVSPAPEIPDMEDSGSLADFHFPKIVRSGALPPNHFAGIGDDGNPFIGELSTGIIPPAREIEAPERAVVGYEEPKPIDTIEKKHELRIKNLEARVKEQADEIEFLKNALDLVIAKVGNLSKNG